MSASSKAFFALSTVSAMDAKIAARKKTTVDHKTAVNKKLRNSSLVLIKHSLHFLKLKDHQIEL